MTRRDLDAARRKAEEALAKYDASRAEDCHCLDESGYTCPHSLRDDVLCRQCIPPLRSLLAATAEPVPRTVREVVGTVDAVHAVIRGDAPAPSSPPAPASEVLTKALDLLSSAKHHLRSDDPMRAAIEEFLSASGAPAPASEALELLREIAASGIAFEDERVRYIELQIDADTWYRFKAYVAALSASGAGGGRQ